jgi:hypothetical protein
VVRIFGDIEMLLGEDFTVAGMVVLPQEIHKNELAHTATYIPSR